MLHFEQTISNRTIFIVGILIALSNLNGCSKRGDYKSDYANYSAQSYQSYKSKSPEELRQEQIRKEKEQQEQQLRDTTARLLQSSARDIVKCFHPSTTYSNISLAGAVNEDYIGLAVGRIKLSGFIRMSLFMDVSLFYNSINKTAMVEVNAENTTFPANKNCALRSWVSIDQMGEAARIAVSNFHYKVLGAVAIAGITAYQMSKEQANSQVRSCVNDLVVKKVVDSATGSVLSDPIAQSAASSALVQAYNGSISGGKLAKDVAVDLFKQKLAQENPSAAFAFSSASFLSCALR